MAGKRQIRASSVGAGALRDGRQEAETGRMQIPKPGKRIVSKGAYAKAQLKRALLLSSAGLLLFASLMGSNEYWNNALRHSSTLRSHHVSTFHNVMISLSSILSIPLTLFIVGTGIIRLMKHSAKISNVTPLTRANTADLPAPDSLVRASAEPVQAQEAVLLRAAAQGQGTSPEQLVRASVAQE